MMSYSRLCEPSADKVDTVNLKIPDGFKFLKHKWIEILKNKMEFTS